jgi:hypothetical protein
MIASPMSATKTGVDPQFSGLIGPATKFQFGINSAASGVMKNSRPTQMILT